MAQLSGTGGADTLSGTADADLIEGLGGNDRIVDGLGGGDQLDGGGGDDIVTLTRTGPALAANILLIGGDGNDELRFADDRLIDNVTIDGGAGSDRIFINGGHGLRVMGGDGDDIFTATTSVGGGTPFDRGATLVGGAGADRFVILPDVAINPIFIEAAESIDRIDISAVLSAKLVGWDGVTNPFAAGYLFTSLGSRQGFPASVSIDLDAGGEAFAPTPLLYFEASFFGRPVIGHGILGYDPAAPVPPGVSLTGSAGADLLTGTNQADTLAGGNGDDRIEGRQGFDRLDGGDGADTLVGGAGRDTLLGASGDDQLEDTGSSDELHGGDGDDIITIAGVTPAGGGHSVIVAGPGDDRVAAVRDGPLIDGDIVSIEAGDGNDKIIVKNMVINFVHSGDGDDVVTLIGRSVDGHELGNGNDHIFDYSTGEHRISLGTGRDYLTTFFDTQSVYVGYYDLGVDTERDIVTLLGRPGYRGPDDPFSAAVVLTGFQGGSGGDVLDFTDFARTTFLGWDGVTNPFAAGYLSLSTSGADTIISIDPDRAGPLTASRIILEQTQQVSLTAANIGWAPDGSSATAVTLTGTAQNDMLNGGSSTDMLSGAAGNDTLQGGFGNDLLMGGSGSNLLIGGGGIDLARYEGLTRQYISELEGAFGTVSGGSEATDDVLELVETIAFRDGYRTTDSHGSAAAVMRLYNSVLDREPDGPGLNNWVHAIEHGSSLKQVALGFTGSIEFQTATGGLNNADFVEYLYVNALGRASDAAGKAGWVSALDSAALDRGDVVVGFSESIEHQARTLDVADQGFFIYDESYAAIASLYDTFADRTPDLAGLIGWAEPLKSGALTLVQIADAFANSGEFKAATSGLDNRGIVELLYRNALEREGDTVGVNLYTGLLDAGSSVGQVMLSFSQSLEHQLLMDSNFNEGIVFG